MAGDVDGSGHAGGLETFRDQGEEFQFGWNEDKVDLEFKTGQRLKQRLKYISKCVVSCSNHHIYSSR